MLKNKLSVMVWLVIVFKTLAQGPPITADKPIMLGEGARLLKTLVEIKDQENIKSVRIPLMFHYLPTSNTLVSVHLPYTFGEVNGQSFDVITPEILAKYQFYRKDGKAKTFRVVAKTLQKIPIVNLEVLKGTAINEYQGYFGLVAGYESIHLGVSNEIGWNYVANEKWNQFTYKFGVGWPLLEPVYPVKQLNLFFETEQSYYHKVKDYQLKYAQGIQYAIGNYTFEVAYQFPIYQEVDYINKFNGNLLLGTRYVF